MITPEPFNASAEEPNPDTENRPSGSLPPGATTVALPGMPPPRARNGLALAALLVGIGAFLTGFVPVFGALVGITALVLGILAWTKQQSKGRAISGIALGGIALLTSIAMTIGIGAAVNNTSANGPAAQSSSSAGQVTAAPTPKPTATEAPAPAASKPAPSTPAPVVPKPAPAVPKPAPAAPTVSAEFRSALNKATSYATDMSMSKAGVYDQLTSQYGEKFSPEAAQYGIDNVTADWNANALVKAKSYQSEMSMSPAAIHDQLTSAYGEKFTQAEADYAIQHLND